MKKKHQKWQQLKLSLVFGFASLTFLSFIFFRFLSLSLSSLLFVPYKAFRMTFVIFVILIYSRAVVKYAHWAHCRMPFNSNETIVEYFNKCGKWFGCGILHHTILFVYVVFLLLVLLRRTKCSFHSIHLFSTMETQPISNGQKIMRYPVAHLDWSFGRKLRTIENKPGQIFSNYLVLVDLPDNRLISDISGHFDWSKMCSPHKIYST